MLFIFHVTFIIDLVEIAYYLNNFKQVFHLLSKPYDKSATSAEALFDFSFNMIDSCII